MIKAEQIIQYLQLEHYDLSEDIIIILGPTASGKTKLAVELANLIDAEIISADSRQVYRGMDIGTGKDISEYGSVKYHLIDIIDAGEKYNVSNFLTDFEHVYQEIRSRQKKVIVCGGTGFYIQALINSIPYAQVPVNLELRAQLNLIDKEEFPLILQNEHIPNGFSIDFSSKKRMIRAIEISRFLKDNPGFEFSESQTYSAAVFGLNPKVDLRRTRISDRLRSRLEEGMIQEVENLIKNGVSFEELEYYGLEYKYISYLLKGEMTYDDFLKKLETEIHRYAKRQMTYYRKMERDGIHIHWLS